MECKNCSGKLKLIIGWKNVFLRCMECGREFKVSEYMDEIDNDTWDLISSRPCNRA